MRELPPSDVDTPFLVNCERVPNSHPSLLLGRLSIPVCLNLKLWARAIAANARRTNRNVLDFLRSACREYCGRKGVGCFKEAGTEEEEEYEQHVSAIEKFLRATMQVVHKRTTNENDLAELARNFRAADMPISEFTCRLQFYLQNKGDQALAKSVSEAMILHYLHATYAEAVVTDGASAELCTRCLPCALQCSRAGCVLRYSDHAVPR
eukprot:COSAG01_NODE_3428_length_6106_cov_13.531547_2_plen_208_part_00